MMTDNEEHEETKRSYVVRFLDRTGTGGKRGRNALLLSRTRSEALEEFGKYQQASPHDRLEMRETSTDTVIMDTATYVEAEKERKASAPVTTLRPAGTKRE
jgi:hypothetical protein